MSIQLGDPIIDSRDVIERIERLAQLRQPGPGDLGPDDNEQDQDTLFAELAEWEDFASQGESFADWEYGEAFILDSHFQEYARQLADDLGIIDHSATHGWPLTCIDWEQAASELRMDYSAIEVNGYTYWARS